MNCCGTNELLRGQAAVNAQVSARTGVRHLGHLNRSNQDGLGGLAVGLTLSHENSLSGQCRDLHRAAVDREISTGTVVTVLGHFDRSNEDGFGGLAVGLTLSHEDSLSGQCRDLRHAAVDREIYTGADGRLL